MSELTLPWPDRRLHPNARSHWRTRARITKIERTSSGWYAEAAGWGRVAWPEGRLHVWLDFYPPDKRRRDTDGLLSSMKAALDGIAAVMGVDDHRFVPHPFLKDEVRKGGEVRVRITGGPA